ncbi:MAG: hypothetical protein N2738_05240 [Thermodesulfovibrionales bacterium]|nr:hypothetical protein [Thermodesulfovibrionales bacterium]
MSEQSITIVHLDDSKYDKNLENAIYENFKDFKYKRMYGLKEFEDYLSEEEGIFILLSDENIPSSIIDDYFRYLDEPDYAREREILLNRMRYFLFYSGDYDEGKTLPMNHRIDKSFRDKYIGGFHRDDTELIIRSVKEKIYGADK